METCSEVNVLTYETVDKIHDVTIQMKPFWQYFCISYKNKFGIFLEFLQCEMVNFGILFSASV